MSYSWALTKSSLAILCLAFISSLKLHLRGDWVTEESVAGKVQILFWASLSGAGRCGRSTYATVVVPPASHAAQADVEPTVLLRLILSF